LQNNFFASCFFIIFELITNSVNTDMQIVSQLVFALALGAAIYTFWRSVSKIRRNIFLGKPINRNDNKPQRIKTMLMVAMGQSKMVKRPLAGIMHIFVYIGFVLINIEVLEIIIDGLAGTHRIFMGLFGSLYTAAIGFFEILGALVLIGCAVFLARRFSGKVPRLTMRELDGWPFKDATYILVIEIVLMIALFIMNAADTHFQQQTSMPISSLLAPMFAGMDAQTATIVERTAWWLHILGILAFLNYLPYSKHFHIILAFPNTYYSDLTPKGEFSNMESVTTEVKLMMDPSAVPPDNYEPPTSFGVKDVTDLHWKNLMDAYSCTECGRCTSVCPANITGKLLSPRKVMMDTRDRLEEVGKNIDKNGQFEDDGKNLHSYVSEEELWACTTCNACAEACPVNINPVEIIYGMRQYLVMEKSQAPTELNGMFTNLENNGAPWQFSPSDRGNWTQEV
jgi:heterodisulfide reductase subunit C